MGEETAALNQSTSNDGGLNGKAKDFTCGNCKDTFASTFNLKKHVKRVHKKFKNASPI